MRDYNALVTRVERLEDPQLEVRQLGKVNGYPVLCVRIGGDASLPALYVNAGTHGDEPAGVEAALALLEGGWERLADGLRFEVIPCLNPWGYVHGMRENAQEVDINWAFLRDDVPEVGLLKSFVEGRRFAATVDLHEDWESPGFYLYEMHGNNASVGAAVARRVAAVCPLNTRAEIEGEVALDGVIFPNMELPKRARGEGIPIALMQRGHTGRLVTTETPTEKLLEMRVAAHLAAVEVVAGAHGGA